MSPHVQAVFTELLWLLVAGGLGVASLVVSSLWLWQGRVRFALGQSITGWMVLGMLLGGLAAQMNPDRVTGAYAASLLPAVGLLSIAGLMGLQSLIGWALVYRDRPLRFKTAIFTMVCASIAAGASVAELAGTALLRLGLVRAFLLLAVAAGVAVAQLGNDRARASHFGFGLTATFVAAHTASSGMVAFFALKNSLALSEASRVEALTTMLAALPLGGMYTWAGFAVVSAAAVVPAVNAVREHRDWTDLFGLLWLAIAAATLALAVPNTAALSLVVGP